MAWVWINPSFQEAASRTGLAAAADFLRLEGAIVSGHPNRHVLRVAPGFLKKEHRVPWRDRLASAWASFGLVSKSTREAMVLQCAKEAGIPCPEVLAYGTAGRQAFLLQRAETGCVELRRYLDRHPDQAGAVASRLGEDLARMHAAGLTHRDLYSKHVLVEPGPRFCFLDWQRARRSRTVTWRCRAHDLATLDATLPASLVSDRMRLALVRSYLRHARQISGPSTRTSVKSLAQAVRRLSTKLRLKPRIRELERLPLPAGTQDLIWLDGEGLCVTRAFREELGDRPLDWLRFRGPAVNQVDQRAIALDGQRRVNLVRRSVAGLGRWLVSWLRRTPAPEVQQAALLFRLQRHGIPAPRLLAFGQHGAPRWGRHSFLLTESPRGHGSLLDVLGQTSSPARRRRLLRGAGALLRRLHSAGYAVGPSLGSRCAVLEEDRLLLDWTLGLERRNHPGWALAHADLASLHASQGLRRTEVLCFFLGYLGTPRLTRAGRALARIVLAAREVAP